VICPVISTEMVQAVAKELERSDPQIPVIALANPRNARAVCSRRRGPASYGSRDGNGGSTRVIDPALIIQKRLAVLPGIPSYNKSNKTWMAGSPRRRGFARGTAQAMRR